MFMEGLQLMRTIETQEGCLTSSECFLRRYEIPDEKTYGLHFQCLALKLTLWRIFLPRRAICIHELQMSCISNTECIDADTMEV